jgi:ABC-2 family transporter protein
MTTTANNNTDPPPPPPVVDGIQSSLSTLTTMIVDTPPPPTTTTTTTTAIRMRSTTSSSSQQQPRTAKPSEWQHIILLVQRNWRNDCKKPHLWAARTLLVIGLMMLYSVGIFAGNNQEPSGSSPDPGVVVIPLNDTHEYWWHPGQDWTFPQDLYLAGDQDIITTTRHIPDAISSLTTASTTRVTVTNETNETAFHDYCAASTTITATNGGWNTSQICVFVAAIDSYNIIYGGGNDFESSESVLAGTQYLINTALVNLSSSSSSWNDSTTSSSSSSLSSSLSSSSPLSPLVVVQHIQPIPQLVETSSNTTVDDDDNNYYIEVQVQGITIGILLGLSTMVMAMFCMSPLTMEHTQEIDLAFLRVGVRVRTYLASWIVYYSFFGILTAAGMAGLCMVWKLFPLSSFGLIFLSFYLVFVQLYVILAFVSQWIHQQELAQSIPFMAFLASLAVALPIMLIESIPQKGILLSLASILSPFIGLLNFATIYSEYDSIGYGTGIHLGQNSNVVTSGLLGSYLGSLGGIVLWGGFVVVMTSPHLFHKMMTTILLLLGRNGGDRTNHYIRTIDNNTAAAAPSDDDHGSGDHSQQHHQQQQDPLEPLSDHAEVLVQIRNLHHTFTTPWYSSYCCQQKDSPKQPVPVLSGLDLDVCRGEVLGFLGHNGAGYVMRRICENV